MGGFNSDEFSIAIPFESIIPNYDSYNNDYFLESGTSDFEYARNKIANWIQGAIHDSYKIYDYIENDFQRWVLEFERAKEPEPIKYLPVEQPKQVPLKKVLKSRKKYASDFKNRIIELLDEQYKKDRTVLKPKVLAQVLGLDPKTSKGYISTLTKTWRTEKNI